MKVPLRYVVLGGPTGAGKTDLAIDIANKLSLEIVSADAFQIYEGLDLLTAKPSPEQLSSVPHHLVGAVPFRETCDAHRYAELAANVIRTLNERGTLPLISGGTGFYLEALSGKLPDLPPPNPAVRCALERFSMAELLERLHQHDPLAWERIDQQNRRRVIRALEVCLTTARPFSSFLAPTPSLSPLPRFWLERSRVELYERINRRVDLMFERGVVSEVAAISEISATAIQTIGFRQIRSHLNGDLCEKDCRDTIKRLTRNYAKRQITWFRNHGYQAISAESAPDQIIASFEAKTLPRTA